MKQSTSRVIPIIQQAINILERDISTNDIKNHLIEALNLANKTEKKRTRRYNL